MGKLRWNERLFFWIIEKIFKHSQNQILPWYLFALRCILCPVSMATWWMERHWIFNYDASSDTFSIYGMKYTGSLFRAWAENGMALNVPFQIVNREDSKFTIQRIEGVMGFGSLKDFRLYMHREMDGCYRLETFLSRELLSEMKNNPAILACTVEDYEILIRQGFDALEGGR